MKKHRFSLIFTHEQDVYMQYFPPCKQFLASQDEITIFPKQSIALPNEFFQELRIRKEMSSIFGVNIANVILGNNFYIVDQLSKFFPLQAVVM